MLRFAIFAWACAACAGQPPTVEPSPDASPAPATGLVLEPTHGSVVAGDPIEISLHVAGLYSDRTRPVAVQILTNPDDLASWETIATTMAAPPLDNAPSAFAVDVRPVTDETERARWPIGGVLRLRVVDDAGVALPIDPEDPTDTVIALANPAGLPAGWTYLSEKPVGSVDETVAYYAAIGAPPTLDDFLTTFGFPGDETTSTYYNRADLGIGREMHCRATDTSGGAACYVRNFGVFGGSRDDAIALTVAGGVPLATVAMVYTPPVDAPNAVTFMVYGPDGTLVNEAQLDTRGDNTSVPQNCLNCHGGRSRYDATTHAVTNARFLPFDPSAFEYSDRADLTFATQEESVRRLDRLVAAAGATAGVRDQIEGMFPVTNTPYDAAFVPAEWNLSSRDARVYREVVAPYCRSCHASFENMPDDPGAFATAATVKQRAAGVVQRVCGAGPTGMPTAEATSVDFFSSGARALLLAWLEVPGACAPAVVVTPPSP